MHSKQRILHLIETVGPGGAETVFADILDYMKSNDSKNCHIAGFTKDGWIYNHIKSRNHEVVLFKTNKIFDYTLIFELVRYIKDNKITLTHSHLPDLSFYSSIAARITNIPHVMTEHGDASHHSKSWKKLFLKYLMLTYLSKKIVCVSFYNKKIIRKRFPWCTKKLVVIHNGIKTTKIRVTALREDMRKNLSIQNNEIALCNVGNLYPVKGQENLIYAFKKVKEFFPFVKLFIIGRGYLENYLKNLVAKLKLEKDVQFLGFRKDVNKILTAMDIFVLSSLSEGFPISLIEAMDAGLSIVAPDTGGVSEFKKYGGDVHLVQNNSPELISKCINELIKKGNYYSQINRRVVKKQFSVETMARKYQNIYTSLIKDYRFIRI